jgi:hypothetical protein
VAAAGRSSVQDVARIEAQNALLLKHEELVSVVLVGVRSPLNVLRDPALNRTLRGVEAGYRRARCLGSNDLAPFAAFADIADPHIECGAIRKALGGSNGVYSDAVKD